jgi:Protein of Unknown function (DUF2784)
MDSILLADIVVTVHLLFVVFVLAGQALIVAGGLLHWGWVRNFWFRLIHLASILIVAVQPLLGITCPLQTLERSLRLQGGAEALRDTANASAIGRFCNHMLYFDPHGPLIPSLYIAFAALVVLTWVFVPPRLPWRDTASSYSAISQ